MSCERYRRAVDEAVRSARNCRQSSPVRAIAHAKVKTDKIDAAVLAKLHASGFLPEVWIADDATEALRRRVAERCQVVSHMTRLKNRIHSVLNMNLIPRYPGKLSASGAELGSLRSRSPRTKGASSRAIWKSMIVSRPYFVFWTETLRRML